MRRGLGNDGGVDQELGPWEPLEVEQIVGLFVGAPFRWWIAGGKALELHAGTSWRPHEDSDVGICRADAVAAYQLLAGKGYHPFVAAGGRLTPWAGRPLAAAADAHENNVWVRQELSGPWVLDLTIGDGNQSTCDPSVRRPWTAAVLSTPDGVPYLAPEIQLLFKSKGLRDKDNEDARLVIPLLDENRRAWLRAALPASHPWQDLA
jgi:hypothetical protein